MRRRSRQHPKSDRAIFLLDGMLLVDWKTTPTAKEILSSLREAIDQPEFAPPMPSVVQVHADVAEPELDELLNALNELLEYQELVKPIALVVRGPLPRMGNSVDGVADDLAIFADLDSAFRWLRNR